ncbi:MAG: hypothetical protein COA78_06945 [Blastopirellula sp.]|nr:MAG: hypothetical protein COA78_06945 [Blastopirellula sp.]
MPELPPLGYGYFLVRYLWEAGPSDFQIEPLTFAEINAWSAGTKTNLTAWEFVTLRKMSEAYCSWYHQGKEPACNTPWKTVNLSKFVLMDKIKSIFASLING